MAGFIMATTKDKEKFPICQGCKKKVKILFSDTKLCFKCEDKILKEKERTMSNEDYKYVIKMGHSFYVSSIGVRLSEGGIGLDIVSNMRHALRFTFEEADNFEKTYGGQVMQVDRSGEFRQYMLRNSEGILR